MSYESTLDTVIASINTNNDILRSLLKNTEDITLRPGDEDTIPPIFNDGTSTWTLNQDVANGSGIYEGVYQLPTGSNCTMLQIVNVVAYQAPLTGAPSRLKPCESIVNPTPTFADQPTLQAIDGQCGSAFIIRSAIPFEVEIALSDCIPVLFEWESSASNTLEGCTAKPRVILRIDGGGVLPNDVEVDITVVGGTATGSGTDYDLLTTSVLFPSGSPDGTTKTVDVEIISDGLTETNETIILGIEPDEGDLGDVTTHTLTILPGGCSKTWSKTFIIDSTNGLQGWTLDAGNLTGSGVQTTNVFLFHLQITLPNFTVPHSSVLQQVTFIPCYSWAANRAAHVTVFGSTISFSNAGSPGGPVYLFPGNCVGHIGWSGLNITGQSGDIVLVMHDNQAPNNGYLQTVVFSGTGIDPFTEV